jgi:hypothetical protein
LEEYFEKALPEVDRKLPPVTLLVQSEDKISARSRILGNYEIIPSSHQGIEQCHSVGPVKIRKNT